MKSKSRLLAIYRTWIIFLLSGKWIEIFGDDCKYRLSAHFDHCGYLEKKTGRGQGCCKSVCPYLEELRNDSE